MVKVQILFTFHLLCSLATGAWNQSGSGTEAYTKSISAPPGSFAMPILFLDADEPLSENPDDISFVLYPDSRSTNVNEVIVYKDPLSLAKVNSSKPTVILIHDFLQNGTTNFPRVIKDAYLKSFGAAYNIIVMDWERLATPNDDELPGTIAVYPSAGRNVKTAGVRLGEFLDWLIKNKAMDYTQTHLVGHGLGAHVAGWAGVYLYEYSGKKVARLSALDPSGFLFEHGLSFRLAVQYGDSFARSVQIGDAEYVDSYHTGKGGHGIGRNTGDADFWINGGGPYQPGCGLNIDGFCSHWRSLDYWRQSIEIAASTERPVPICACRTPGSSPNISNCCEVMVEFGQPASPKAMGTYFVNIDVNV